MLQPLLRRFLRLRLWLIEKIRPGELQATLLWAALVGFLGGMASILFRWGVEGVQYLLIGKHGDLIVTAADFPWWERLILPVAGGLFAGAALHYGMRFVKGQSSTDYMEAIVLGNGEIRSRPTLVKSLSSLFTIASGGSIGREGPMVQLSAMIGSWAGRRFHLSTPRLQLLVACGAAAGIASAYNAPIAGALFVAEIVLGSIAMESFGPLVLASVIATVTVQQVFHGKPVYQIPSFQLVSNWELGPYLLLGLLAGAVAPPFLHLLEGSERFFTGLRLNPVFRLGLGGLVVGLLSVASLQVWGNGYEVVDAILGRDIVWQSVLLILVLKVLATAATSGSGAVGGVFTPTLFVGAAFGFLFGTPVHALWPLHTGAPSAYALVGMGALLAATTHAPLMAILMLFEMTLDHAIILPLMLACVVAHYVSQSIRPQSIYARVLLRKRAQAPVSRTSDLRVRDLVKPRAVTVPVTAHFDEIARSFAANRYNYLYVVDEGNRFRGAIALHDIKAYLNHPDLADLAIALDLMRDDLPVLTPGLPLGDALTAFGHHDGERLPVIASREDPVLLGALSKTDLLLTLAHAPQETKGGTGDRPEAPGMPVGGGAPRA